MENNFRERLMEAMNKRHISQSELARASGITEGAISSYISGRYKPKRDSVAMLAKALNINPVWLSGFDVDMENSLPSYDSDTGILTIPFINQKLSAGPGEDYLSPDAIEVRKINVFAHVAKGLDRKTLVAAEVRGDSMIGENISSGDVVIFSRGLINQEGIYVINYAGDINIKRLDFDGLANKVSIISANPKYPTKVVDADCVTILGKVVGLIHAFDF